MINRFAHAVSLAEISQSLSARFSLLKRTDEGFDEKTPMVKCRDFLCDVYSSSPEQQKFSFSIYGMSWDGTKDSPDWSGTNLLMKFPDEKAKENFLKNLAKLHAIEEHNKIPLTKITEFSPLEYVIEGDVAWLMSVLSFSLYTLFLRILCYPLTTEDWITEFSKQSHSDSVYIKNIPMATLDAILNDLNILRMEEWNGLSYAEHGVHGVHSNSGIVSVCSNHSECNQSTVRKNKHWQKFQELGLDTYTKP